MSGLPQILLETSFLSAGRVAFFFACRYYLLRSLYHDLWDLSTSKSNTDFVAVASHETLPRNSETELDELPTPATASTPRTTSNTRSHFSLRSERTWHSSLSRGTFSLCFSESCMLFLLITLQAMDIFSEEGRYLNWRLSLGILLFTLLLAAPLQQCFLLTYKSHKSSERSSRSWKSYLLFTGIPYTIYLIVLSHIPLPSRLESPGKLNMSSLDLTTSTLARLVVLGTIILGLLAGFGAVSAVFTYLQLSRAGRKTVSEAQIVASEQALFRIRNDLLERQRQIDRKLSGLRREIQGLEALEYQMTRNLEYLQQGRSASLYAETLHGRIWIWIGQFFAIYCAFRVINSLINILYPLSSQAPVSTPDLLASLLTRFFSLFFTVSEGDIIAISRQFSLLLVGAIILSSVRRALRGVTRILKVTSKNLGASLLLLVLAQLLGTYLLSTLIQLRTSFPSPSSDDERLNLFSTLPQFHVFGPLWDGAFLASVAVCGVLRWLDDRVNGPNVG
ncbi:Abscisic acid G-protein coupled receptor-domain-containing protein [Hysterangium stoloniferum]|nr:Abscisic acid G-protein coupled receptor-domain-containing protein [Hysterangium stoloniferum]